MHCFYCDRLTYHFRLDNLSHGGYKDIFSCCICGNKSKAAMDDLFHTKSYFLVFSGIIQLRAEYKFLFDHEKDIFINSYIYEIGPKRVGDTIELSYDLHWKDLPKLKDIIKNYKIL